MKKSSSVSILDLKAANMGDATATLTIKKRKISEGDDRILQGDETSHSQLELSDDCNDVTKNNEIQEKSACSTSLSDQNSALEKT
jgi:hypothetical protein